MKPFPVPLTEDQIKSSRSRLYRRAWLLLATLVLFLVLRDSFEFESPGWRFSLILSCVCLGGAFFSFLAGVDWYSAPLDRDDAAWLRQAQLNYPEIGAFVSTVRADGRDVTNRELGLLRAWHRGQVQSGAGVIAVATVAHGDASITTQPTDIADAITALGGDDAFKEGSTVSVRLHLMDRKAFLALQDAQG